MIKLRNLAAATMNETVRIMGFSPILSNISAARLRLLGFIPGETATPILISPLGDPSVYLLGTGAQIALRAKDASCILVE